VPVSLGNNPDYTLGDVRIKAVSASAARARDGKLYLALVNTNPRETADVDVDVAGAGVKGATGSLLTAAAMDAHNTYAAPDAVKPAPYAAQASGGKLTLHLPAKSVVVVAVQE